MKNIDFSSKHDIWLQNWDGTLKRMDEPYYETEKVAEGTWKIFSSGDFSYLAEGDQKAIAIDTGYGAGNIRAYMQTLTDKPLTEVINTHDHFDHTANNGYFDRAYMGEKTVPLATVPFPSFKGIDFPQDYERIAVGDGYVFDLGGRTLEVFSIPDHAAGSIALLDRKERILFSGDEYTPGGKRLNGGLITFAENLQKVRAHRDEFDRLCGGPVCMTDASLIDQLWECVQFILAGHEGSEPEPGAPLPLPKSPDDQGRTVYHRQLPHPEDMKHDGENTAACWRSVTYAGVTITYDLNKKDQ